MKKTNVKFTAQAALIAAAYLAATYLSALLGVAYGPVQFRFSEALCILAVFTPAAIPGLSVGCFIANLTSPYGAVDMLIGTAATLISALLIYLSAGKFKKSEYLAPVFPTVVNAVMIGAEITFFLPHGEKIGFLLCAAQIAAGEAAVCFGLGIPLALVIKKRFPELFKL